MNQSSTNSAAVVHTTVFQALSQSRASLLNSASLGDGLELALWRNANDETQYHRPGHHTAWVALSEHHFALAFRQSFAVTPHAWVLMRRIERAKTLLREQPSWSLDAVAQACGLASASHLVRRFCMQTGISPGRWRCWSRV